jgi:hypothetical protein
VYLVVASNETGLNPARLSADVGADNFGRTGVVWSDLFVSSAARIDKSSLQVNR